ncbi:MAG: endolytic transglycosylase MltG [Lachnospiraceae bacterium]
MNFKQLTITLGTIVVKVVVAYFIIINVAKYAATAYDFGFRIFTEEPMTGQPGITYNVTITEETTPKQVANALEEYGLIRNQNLFYAQYMVSEYKDKFVPGNYDLNTSMTAEEMMAVMSPGADEEEAEE